MSKRTIFIILAGGVLLLLGSAIFVHKTHMFVFRKASMSRVPRGDKQLIRPLGVVWLVNSDQVMHNDEQSIGFQSYALIYEALGATQQSFERWMKFNGVDSLGVDRDGRSFLPNFPVFSKVAWMHIEPVTLTQEETLALVDECDRAILTGVTGSAKRELEAVRALAQRAVINSAVLQFGHS